MHNPVHKTVLPLKLSRLKVLRQTFLGRALYNPSPREADSRLWLGDYDVSGGGERGRHPPKGRIGQHGDVWLGAGRVAREGHAGLCHLHKGVDALVHPRPPGGRDDHERQLLVVGELHRTRYPLSHDATHRTTDKPEVHRHERGRAAPDPRRPAQHRVVEAGFFARALKLLLVVLETQGVPGPHAGVALLEASGISQEAYAFGGRERVVELAVRAHVEAGLKVLLVDRLPAPAVSAEEIPNPRTTGTEVLARALRRRSTAPCGSRSRIPVTPVTETQYTKPEATSAIFSNRSSSVVGAASGQIATPLSAAISLKSRASPTGRSGITSPKTPAPAASSKNLSIPRVKMTL